MFLIELLAFLFSPPVVLLVVGLIRNGLPKLDY
jgi:hypothetical protein